MRCPDFEQLLGCHAAPLLMGLAVGSLLSFQKSRFDDFEALLASYEPCFSCKGVGYRAGESMEDCLDFLRLRMRVRKTLPPEVGLFLGYPPEDVCGFIARRGRDFVCSGYWKVYANEAEARALFEQYSVCTQEFCTRLAKGYPLAELVQAV